jgi:outer membrane receptor protein involved in Fe transport
MTPARRNSSVALVLLVLFLLKCSALAGTTGKITGRAVDKASNEPLIGVTLTIEGRSRGGATDATGTYTILNVPPGSYRLKASLLGYGTTVVTDARVIIDQTTNVGFEMSEQAIESGEVVITAERRAVQRDVSTSVASVTNAEVSLLPVTSVSEVVGLQAGVEGGLVIRGGAADQSLFLLDGVTLRDPRNNQPISSVPLSAVKEMNVERGGFNAEYGQLQAGIINVVTKEGAENRYTVSVTARYSPPAKKYFGTSPFDPNSMWLRPYLDPAVAWTGTQNGEWDIYTQRQYPQFEGWNSISEAMFAAGAADALSPAGAQRLFMWQHRKREESKSPDYNIDFGIGGPVVPASDVNEKLGNLRFFLSYRNQRNMLLVPLTRTDYFEYVWSLRLTSDVGKGMKLDLTGTLGKSYNVAPNDVESFGSSDFIRSPGRITQDFNLQPASVEARLFIDSYYSLADVANGSLAALFTHVLSPTAYYEVRLEHVYRTYDTGPIARRDTTRQYEIFPGYFVDESPFGFDPILHSGIGSGMWMGGHTSTTRDNSRISATTLKGDFSAQVDPHNLIKAGLEFVYNDLQLDYGYVSQQFPNENDTTNYRRKPYRGALFVQDKLEFEGWIANLGLRADFSQANVEWPTVGTYDRAFFGGNNPGLTIPTADSKMQFELSPRLGISHPITENSKLFFNYGHFRQLPTYEELLRQSRGAGGAMKQYGDPNLAMARTIAYELGYDHSLLDNSYLLQLAAFYRDISDLQNTTQYFSQRNSVNYIEANNNGYQDIRGFELTFKKTRGRWFNGFVNYTYQSVSGGFFDRAAVSDDPTVQQQYDRDINSAPQYRSVPRPYARLNVTFFTPPDLGDPGAMRHLLGDWTVTLLGDWRAGDYVTWNPNQVALASPNLQMVDWYNLNLRLTKTIPIGSLQLTFLMDMTNVFNTKRLDLNTFYDGRDQQYYFESLHLPVSNAFDNIPGDDKAGDYRKEGVAYQPMEWTRLISNVTNPMPEVIYYEKETGRYMNYLNNQWSEVDPARLKQVLDDKAYIDMPNMTSFWFLNPRNTYFGVTVAFNF